MEKENTNLKARTIVIVGGGSTQKIGSSAIHAQRPVDSTAAHRFAFSARHDLFGSEHLRSRVRRRNKGNRQGCGVSSSSSGARVVVRVAYIHFDVLAPAVA